MLKSGAKLMLLRIIAKCTKNLGGSCYLISFMKRSITKFVELKLKKTEIV
jgi:hypothetical protein